MSILAAENALLTVDPLTSSQQLSALAGEWNLLAGDIPFRSWEWMEAWWRFYRRPPDELLTLTVRRDDGELVGLAPWYLGRSLAQGRVIRFLGSGRVCSDYLSILCKPSYEANVILAIRNWLSTDFLGGWDALEFSGVEQSDESIAALLEQFRARDHVVEVHADSSCWRVSLPETWDEFLKGLSKSRRERTRMLYRRNFADGRAVLREVDSIDDLGRGLEILIDLHQKRRKSLGQGGCFADKRFTSFHRQVAERMLTRGKLRLMWTEIEGQPIAVEYGFIGGDTIYYYQGGFDPDRADERPGWLSFTGSLKQAIEQGYRSYDFLRGDESYKASWRAEPRPLVGVRIVGASAHSRIRHAARRTGEGAKALARRGLELLRHAQPASEPVKQASSSQPLRSHSS